MLIEAIRRKPVNQKIEAGVHLCGYVLLFGIMIFFTFKDVLSPVRQIRHMKRPGTAFSAVPGVFSSTSQTGSGRNTLPGQT